MTDPIRDAPERLVAADRFIGEAGPEYAQAREAARAVLAAPTPEPDTDAALKLAAIIREVGSINHRLGAAALAEAILAHPAAREVFASLTMPAGGAAMSDTARAVLQRHVAAFRVPGQSLPVQERIAMAEEALAAPTPPGDGEAEELAQFLDDCACAHFAHGRPQFARAAALLRQLPPDGLEAIRYCVADDGVVIQLTSKAPESWAARSGSSCMSHTGEWEIEPQPSERTDEWLSTHRWPTLAAAWEALRQSRQGEVGDD